MTRTIGRTRGFTLIELMMVVGIIGILAAVALPEYQVYVVRARVGEGLVLAHVAQRAVAEHYDRWGRLPADNAAAGLPRPELARGAHVASITVRDGAVEVRFDPKNVGADGKSAVYLRPAVSRDNPTMPILWICSAKVTPPAGYELTGKHGDDAVEARHVPAVCR